MGNKVIMKVYQKETVGARCTGVRAGRMTRRSVNEEREAKKGRMRCTLPPMVV